MYHESHNAVSSSCNNILYVVSHYHGMGLLLFLQMCKHNSLNKAFCSADGGVMQLLHQTHSTLLQRLPFNSSCGPLLHVTHFLALCTFKWSNKDKNTHNSKVTI